MNPQTNPIPRVTNESPIYDQLVVELGDPHEEDEDIALAEIYFQEGKRAYSEFVQNIYVERIDAQEAVKEAETDVLPAQSGATAFSKI